MNINLLDINRLRNQLKNSTCMIVGDIMLDKYIYGNVERISPEAPIPVVRVREKKYVLGGAANVANNITGYGVHSILVGIIGDDIEGKNIINELNNKGIGFSGMISKSRVTTLKTRIIGKKQQMVRMDEEDTFAITKDDRDQLLSNIEAAMDDINMIVISDYNKGLCTPELCQQIIKIAHEKGIRVIVDPKEKKWDKYSGADLITPNFSEFTTSIGYEIENTEADIIVGAKQLRGKYDIDNILVTRSEYGMTLVNNQEAITFDTVAKEVADVSGAGDTVIATVAAFASIGTALPEALEIANIAAGIAVGKLGTYVVSLDEVIADITAKEYASRIGVVDEQTLDKLLIKWNKENKKIVFTNGCFDILHRGHVTYLEKAKQLGDILVVGLNSDRSVKALKGESRPVNNEEDRAYMLAALLMVDVVVIFDQDTPYELIRKVKPEVLVKGGDYEPDEIVGREFAKEVITIPIVEGCSTTSIIRRIEQGE